MPNNIKQIDDRLIIVNGKSITKDTDGVWLAKYDELTPSEEKAFNNYLRAIKHQDNATKRS